jgi:ATP-dependent Lhr-like helicase
MSKRASSVSLQRGATISRATPITLALRADLPWLHCALRDEQKTSDDELTAGARALLECLRARGASFSSELRAELGLKWNELSESLWDAVAHGRLTADGFGALRSLLSRRAAEPAPSPRRLRHGAGLGTPQEGRWSLLQAPRELPDPDALAEAVAEQLLARWGVVFADLMARENLALPYRDIVWALRRLEARGVVRGGRFVSGFVGEQYGLPEAIELLRETRRTPHNSERISVSACDPLNLVGVVVPGARVPAQRGRRVTYVDGAAIEPAAATTPDVASADVA